MALPAADESDLWDEPTVTGPDASAGKPTVTEKTAASGTEPESASSDQLVDVGTVGDEEVAVAAEEVTASDAVTAAPAPEETEQTETQAAEKPTAAPTGFTGDAALLDEPDPWD